MYLVPTVFQILHVAVNKTEVPADMSLHSRQMIIETRVFI